MNINHVVISGNLTHNPELRTISSGTSILNMQIACNERKKNKSTGEWEDHPNFLSVVLFGQKADFFAHRVEKGMKVVIEGKLRIGQWERDGQKQIKVEIIANELDLFAYKKSSPSTSEEPEIAEEDIDF